VLFALCVTATILPKVKVLSSHQKQLWSIPSAQETAFFSSMGSGAHACTRTHMHAYTHTLTHIHVHTHAHTGTHMHKTGSLVSLLNRNTGLQASD
jgi:hypothetical protein